MRPRSRRASPPSTEEQAAIVIRAYQLAASGSTDWEETSQRLAKTRDVAAWQATMARPDGEQQVARQPRQQQTMAPGEVVAYLRSLPSLWADSGPGGRQALASALFTKLEVEGYTKMRYQLTPDAVTLGLGAALPAQTEAGGHTGGFGRGERSRAYTFQISVTVLDGDGSSITSRSSDVA